MRLTRWIVCLAPLILLAAPEEKKSAPKAERGGRLTLPKEAVKIEPFTYRYKDPQGKVWIYRQTPFGLVRYEDSRPSSGNSAASSAQPVTPPAGMKAFDEGDQVRFERMGPFGKYTWRRKKGELTREERLAWEASKKAKAKPVDAPRSVSSEKSKKKE